MSTSIGFIGLGLLGLPAATNLLDKGHALRVYNRTASKADPLVARGAVRAETPADVCTPGGIVVSFLWGDAAVLDRLLTQAGLQVIGGTVLFRLAKATDAAGWAARLGRAGILVRSFADAPARLRFGIPGDPAAWDRLATALGLGQADAAVAP